MLTSKSVLPCARFVRYGFAMKCTLLSVAAIAGSPPVFQGDGSGPIERVPPYHRLACTAVDSDAKTAYPKGFAPNMAMKQALPKDAGKPKGGVLYVETPVIPGAQVKKTSATSGRFNYCVQPFLVNTGDGPSPAGITVYLTRNPEVAPHLAGVDTALVTALLSNATPRSASVPQSIPAKATHIIPQIWCTTLSESAAKGLSLFVNVPAQSLLVEQTTDDGTHAAGAGTASTKTQKVGASSAALANADAATRLRVAVQQYSTVCKLDFDNATASDKAPQPRVLIDDAAFAVPSVVPLPAYLPTTVSTTAGMGIKPKPQLSPK